ncbi:MAG TPA: hypothetical protein VEZ20_14315 [Allosphingosinicella sp.]|jgi:hypothetical protein|nr:hypothetical protein [Allosphingosinicella sp.]
MADIADENSALGFRSRTVEGDLGMLEALRDYYLNDPHVAGSGDLLLITGGKPAERAGLIASVLAGFGLDDGERLIQRYLIIAPPDVDPGTTRAGAWEHFERGFKELAGAALDDNQRAWFETSLFYVHVKADPLEREAGARDRGIQEQDMFRYDHALSEAQMNRILPAYADLEVDGTLGVGLNLQDIQEKLRGKGVAVPG